MKKFDTSVNGLRAIAILIVIAFHYGMKTFSGGFVGVDIFFVISGFVITQSIYTKLKAKSFSVVDYFKSRFFRIFPALLMMTFVTLLLSSLILLPIDAERTAWHALSSITFLSNFVFWKEVGYFDVDNDFKPLLHTWSLSVEWQFYLLWPIAVFVLYALKKISVPMVILSIILGIIASGLLEKYSNFVFYMMPFRGWEFALGALIAFVPDKAPIRQIFPILSLIIGFSGIFISSVFYSTDTTFPGFAATLPCISAFTLLFFNRKYSSPILAFPLFQYLGNISYSLYLYHWPVLLLYKHFVFRELYFYEIFIVLAIVLLLSHVSYKYIEQPFRNRNSSHKRLLLILIVVVSSLCSAMSYYVISTDGKMNRYNKQQNELIDYFRIENEAYKNKYGVFYPKTSDEVWSAEKHLNIPCLYDNYLPKSADDNKITNCVINNNEHHKDKESRYLVIGDSNGKNIYEALIKAFPDKGFSILMHSGCAPAQSKNCFPFLRGQLENIFANTKIDGVILSSRYSYQSIEGMKNTVDVLTNNKMPFIIIGSTPMLRRTVDMIFLRKGISLDASEFSLPLNDTYFQPDIFEKDKLLQNLAVENGGVFYDKKNIICPDNICYMKLEKYNRPIYLDSQHLSEDGIDLLVQAFKNNDVVNKFIEVE